MTPSRRRPSKHTRPVRPLALGPAGDTRDGTWVVRRVAGGDKDYTCPGCHRVIPAGSGHLVTWPATPRLGASSGIDDRRHWHPACWQRTGATREVW